MSQSNKLALSLFLTALILGVLGDVLLSPTPWGINVVLWVVELSFGLVAVAQWTLDDRWRGRLSLRTGVTCRAWPARSRFNAPISTARRGTSLLEEI